MSKIYKATLTYDAGGWDEASSKDLGFYQGDPGDITVFLTKNKDTRGILSLKPVDVINVLPQDVESAKSLLNKKRILKEELDNTESELKKLGYK